MMALKPLIPTGRLLNEVSRLPSVFRIAMSPRSALVPVSVRLIPPTAILPPEMKE